MLQIYLNDEEHERLLFGEYTYVFADLEPRTVYLVSVTAFTGAGEGPKADLKIQTGDRKLRTVYIDINFLDLWDCTSFDF